MNNFQSSIEPKAISKPEESYNRVYVCPECKMNLPLLQTMIRDDNNDLIITAKCECKTFTLPIKEFVSLIRETKPKDDKFCYFKKHKHPKIGIAYCPIDGRWYCENCKEMHDDHTSDHVTLKYEIKNESPCTNKEHKKPMKYYCYNCRVPLCDDCLPNHREHMTPDASGLEDKIKKENKFKNGVEIKQYWKEMINNFKNEGKEIIDDINNFIEKLKQMKHQFEIIQQKKIEELNAQSYLHRALFEEYNCFTNNFIALINFHSVSKVHSNFKLYQSEPDQYYIAALEEKFKKYIEFSPIELYNKVNENEATDSGTNSNPITKLYKNVDISKAKLIMSVSEDE